MVDGVGNKGVSGMPDGVNVIRTHGLLAEYTVGKAPSGEWFAYGSIRSEHDGVQYPAWTIIGTGLTPEAAVAVLRDELDGEARRVGVAG